MKTLLELSAFGKRLVCLATMAALAAPCLCAQEASALPDGPEPRTQQQAPPEKLDLSLRSLPGNLWSDQKAIWTSPRHLNEPRAVGPVLLFAATALLATADHQIMTEKAPTDPVLRDRAATASNAMLGAFAVAPAAFYLLGKMRHRQDFTETGVLSGEAMVDTLVMDESVKAVARRERPTINDARGRWFQAFSDSSFPSNHAGLAWASATVIAHEYRGPLTQLTAYGLATGVSAMRVVSYQHFPADALAGSILGWMIGRYVFQRHSRYSDSQ